MSRGTVRWVRVALATLPLLLFSACQDSQGGFRCATGSVCTGGVQRGTQSTLSLACQAVAPSQAPVNRIFDVTVNASGGVPPYYTLGSSPFEGTTTVSGGFSTSGPKHVTLEVFDSEGDRALCSFTTVVGSQNLTCDMTIEGDNYSPRVDEPVRFLFAVSGHVQGVPISYNFVKDVRREQVGLVYTGTNANSAYTVRYDQTGDKKPVLVVSQYVNGQRRTGLCAIEHLPVRDPDFTIEGPILATIDGTGSPAEIELEFEDNGEFDGQLTYTSTISYDGGLVSVEDTATGVVVTSTTTVYQVVELRVVATSTRNNQVVDRVEKRVNLFFVPTTLCRINVVGGNSTLVRGQEASLVVDTSIGNGEAVDILDVDPDSGGQVLSGKDANGIFTSPVRVRYSTAGTKNVLMLAQTRTTNALCVDASGELVSVDLTVNEPPHCVASATHSSQFVGQPIGIHASVPSGVGVGPFVIENLEAEAGSGYAVAAADSRATFQSGASGTRDITFSIGRPSPGISYLVTAYVRDQGRPSQAPFTCQVRVHSVLPAGSEACFAQFQRNGQAITSARTRDAIDVVVNANFAFWGSIYSGGSRVISSGPLGWSHFPYRAYLNYDLINALGASSNTTFTVASGAISRSCTAQLGLTEALKCSFPNGATAAAMISTTSTFPNGDNPNGSVSVTNRIRVNNGVGDVTLTFDDRSSSVRTQTIAASTPNGAVNADVDLAAIYTRHGQFPLATARARDAYDATGGSCNAPNNQLVHTVRTAKVFGANNDNLPSTAKCKIKVQAIHNLTGKTDLDLNGVADRTSIWLFANLDLQGGSGTTYNTYYRATDFHNMAPGETRILSVNWPLDQTQTHCDVSVKTLGTGVNPGDFRVWVYAVNASGTRITPEHQLPDLLQQ